MQVKIGDNHVSNLDAEKSIKTLGVCLNPSITWKDEFAYVRKKMHVSVTKLMNTKIEVYQAHTCFNACMLTNVFCGCGIVKFSEQQCMELKRLYETPMAHKLGLGQSFPRAFL